MKLFPMRPMIAVHHRLNVIRDAPVSKPVGSSLQKSIFFKKAILENDVMPDRVALLCRCVAAEGEQEESKGALLLQQ